MKQQIIQHSKPSKNLRDTGGAEPLAQGAEAIIYKIDNKIKKHRVIKGYRHPELDNKLRTRRTKAESKIITKLKSIIPVPTIISTNTYQIIMQYISGKKLSENLEKLDYKNICKQIGQTLTLLHNQDIIHGDLTTSNMIFKPNETNKKENPKENLGCLYLIDFGLGFHSRKIEDKAVDLHLIQQALNAKHYKIADKAFQIILKYYKPDKYKLIIERIKVIESRGRYKDKK